MSQKIKTDLRIGAVLRADNSGLGTLSYDFYKHLPFSKIMIAGSTYEQFYDRYDGAPNGFIAARGIPTRDECLEFVKDLDMLVCFETPYNWNLIKYAREQGVKTALVVMYEWTPMKDSMPEEFDLYLCPTQLDYDTLWGNKVLIPVPVDREKTKFIKRTGGTEFLFNNGHGGTGGRNSINEFLQALPFVESDVTFHIRSQVPFEMDFKDKRVKITMGEVPHEALWAIGDVYIHLHKFDGLSLPLQEALSAGLPILAIDREPYNTILPKEMMIPPSATGMSQLPLRDIQTCTVAPKIIAQKIDEIAKMGSKKIEELSEKSNELAEEFSWEKLAPKYMEEFENLCKK
jgi:glycosyltransferase involved in cell wall biosynthesis|tara:strand:- start:10829 stop:11863 length:1035 start_codon:yes stop_codon:yes gene_type:complete